MSEIKATQNAGQVTRHAHLVDLWQRIGTLNEQDWGKLYTGVCSILAGCNRHSLAQTPYDFEDLVQQYFLAKIFIPAQNDPAKIRAQMPQSHGALIGFFKNFVISVARSAQSKMSQRSDALQDDDGNILSEAEHGANKESVEDNLQRCGLVVPKVTRDTRRFLKKLSPLQLVLLRNYAHQDISINKLVSPAQLSLARVAVAQLGLWTGQSRTRSLDKFSKTLIGRFMTNAIGEPLNESHQEDIKVLMSFLCNLA